MAGDSIKVTTKAVPPPARKQRPKVSGARRFFALLGVAIMALAVLFGFFTVINVRASPKLPVGLPTVQSLRHRYGAARNLSHAGTRIAYHTALKEVAAPHVKNAKANGEADAVLAAACSALRYRARIYARTRDAEGFGAYLGPLQPLLGGVTAPLFDYVLGARDALVHGILHGELGDVIPCLLQMEPVACPSYPALRRRYRSDAQAFDACWRTNAAYDTKFAPRDQQTNNNASPPTEKAGEL